MTCLNSLLNHLGRLRAISEGLSASTDSCTFGSCFSAARLSFLCHYACLSSKDLCANSYGTSQQRWHPPFPLEWLEVCTEFNAWILKWRKSVYVDFLGRFAKRYHKDPQAIGESWTVPSNCTSTLLCQGYQSLENLKPKMHPFSDFSPIF